MKVYVSIVNTIRLSIRDYFKIRCFLFKYFKLNNVSKNEYKRYS